MNIFFSLSTAKLFLIGPVKFQSNIFSESSFKLRQSTFSIKGYIEFSANKGHVTIEYESTRYYYLKLTENTILNVSHNNFTYFAYTVNKLLKISMSCYFQYFSKR